VKIRISSTLVCECGHGMQRCKGTLRCDNTYCKHFDKVFHEPELEALAVHPVHDTMIPEETNPVETIHTKGKR
jgi:hypothetical protein